jgi:hypothetical protein
MHSPTELLAQINSGKLVYDKDSDEYLKALQY